MTRSVRMLLITISLLSMLLSTQWIRAGGNTLYHPFTLRSYPAPPMNGVYFTDYRNPPSAIWQYDLSSRSTSIIYQHSGGQIFCFELEKYPQEIFFTGTDNHIYRVRKLDGNWQAPEIVFTHTTYVRDLAFGPDGALYFSESHGTADDGKIYRLEGKNAILFYEVKLADVARWFGNFSFDENGVLYLSQGNVVGARLWRVEQGMPKEVYRATGSVIGFEIRENRVLYANWRQNLYLVDLATGKKQLLYAHPSAGWLSDVQVLGPMPSFQP